MFGVLVFIFVYFLWSSAMKISAASETYALRSDSQPFWEGTEQKIPATANAWDTKHTTSIPTKYVQGPFIGERSSREPPALSWELANRKNEVELFWIVAAAYALLHTSAKQVEVRW